VFAISPAFADLTVHGADRSELQRREKNIIGATIDNTFTSAPEERPILFVLQKVRGEN
jgi:hypothetical protein